MALGVPEDPAHGPILDHRDVLQVLAQEPAKERLPEAVHVEQESRDVDALVVLFQVQRCPGPQDLHQPQRRRVVQHPPVERPRSVRARSRSDSGTAAIPSREAAARIAATRSALPCATARPRGGRPSTRGSGGGPRRAGGARRARRRSRSRSLRRRGACRWIHAGYRDPRRRGRRRGGAPARGVAAARARAAGRRHRRTACRSRRTRCRRGAVGPRDRRRTRTAVADRAGQSWARL